MLSSIVSLALSAFAHIRRQTSLKHKALWVQARRIDGLFIGVELFYMRYQSKSRLAVRGLVFSYSVFLFRRAAVFLCAAYVCVPVGKCITVAPRVDPCATLPYVVPVDVGLLIRARGRRANEGRQLSSLLVQFFSSLSSSSSVVSSTSQQIILILLIVTATTTTTTIMRVNSRVQDWPVALARNKTSPPTLAPLLRLLLSQVTLDGFNRT